MSSHFLGGSTMAVFRPEQESNVCKLNFDDKFNYELPLHEDENLRIANIAKEQVKKLKGLQNVDTREVYDKIYNDMLDALDEILGEGAGADIMSIFPKPSLLDVGDVLTYITKEYGLAYNARLNKHKAAASVPKSQAGGKKGRR